MANPHQLTSDIWGDFIRTKQNFKAEAFMVQRELVTS